MASLSLVWVTISGGDCDNTSCIYDGGYNGDNDKDGNIDDNDRGGDSDNGDNGRDKGDIDDASDVYSGRYNGFTVVDIMVIVIKSGDNDRKGDSDSKDGSGGVDG